MGKGAASDSIVTHAPGTKGKDNAMKKFMFLFALLLIPSMAFASVGVQVASVNYDAATVINCSTGTVCEVHGGVLELQAAATGAAATITSGTINGATIGASSPSTVKGTTVTATTSVVTPMLKITATASTARPASGATAGTIVTINDANDTAPNCGAAGSGGTTFVVCLSDGTNWKKIA